MNENTVKKLKVNDLRHQLKIRAQSAVGKKAELIERLLKALTDNVPVFVNVALSRSREKKEKDVFFSNVGRGFPPIARWRPLVPDGGTVKEPSNPTFNASIPEQDAGFIPAKYNFSQYKFVVPKFTGTKEIIKTGRKKRKV